MGVVTGKGLSDLIREEFGFRPYLFRNGHGLSCGLGDVVAEFAGVAASMQIFGISKYVAVPYRSHRSFGWRLFEELTARWR